jgi:hypothetical protein
MNDWLAACQSRQDLIRLLQQRDPPAAVAEIGVEKGWFTEELLVGLPGARVLAVDPWEYQSQGYRDGCNLEQAAQEKLYQACLTRLAPFGDRVTIDRAYSHDAAVRVPDASLDLAYIDANHSYDAVCRDLQLWFPKVKPGKILAGHDYQPGSRECMGVIPAVDEFVRAQGLRLFLMHGNGDCSWAVRKHFDA